MILGDYRADDPFSISKEIEKIQILTDKNFHWLITGDMDTTANRTYDRQNSLTGLLLTFCHMNIQV